MKERFVRLNSSLRSPVSSVRYQVTLLVGLPENFGEKAGAFLCQRDSIMVLHAHISCGG
jgi:hypothetical protein